MKFTHKCFVKRTMIRTSIMCILLSASLSGAYGQDTARSFSIYGYGEVYYGFDFNQPKSNERPSFVYTHNRHNEVNVNLAMLKANCTKERARANVALAAGTYVNTVYGGEPGVLKNLFEANIGVKLLKRHSLWIDAGVLPSHIGFESALATDCATLTRSMIAENSPYYESGARLSFSPANERWYFAALLLNGWQRIQRPAGHTGMSGGSQITYRPTSKLTVNYSTFLGNVGPDSAGMQRVFHNLYVTAQVTKRLNLTGGFDFGVEQRTRAARWSNWMGGSMIAQYKPDNKSAVAVRAEYFRDDSSVIIKTGTPGGFRTMGFSANFDYYITENVRWRVEGKTFVSQAAIYVKDDGSYVATSPAATMSLCVHF